VNGDEQDSYLEALLDGEITAPDNTNASPALLKLGRLQKAFAALQWSAAEKPAFSEDEVLFRWQHLAVLTLIGSGGFGEVYKAWDDTLEREVALKLRHRSEGFAPAAGRAFIEEARRLARVRHPNVLAVHGAGVADQRAGMWTDLIDGETLQQEILTHGVLTPAEILHLASSLADALGAVHRAGIIHGDLKPANVMRERFSGRIVLMDFGAGARLNGKGEAWLSSGSTHYMAPEQASGDKVGAAVDVFALGAVLHFAATATTFDKNFVALEKRRELPKPIRSLIGEMLRTNEAARPSVNSIAQSCHYFRGEPERRRRRRLRYLVFAALASTALVATVGYWWSSKARAAAELERNRAVATQDFLLGILRSPNPYQAPNPTRRLDALFENAVAALPGPFANDPATQGRLLQQFGRSLIILDRYDSAFTALSRAQTILQANVPATHPALVDTRSVLSDLYRLRRDYPSAIKLTATQMTQCLPKPALPASNCLALRNDQIEANGFAGDSRLALNLAAQAEQFAQANQLDHEYEAVFVDYLTGVFLRQRGELMQASQRFVQLTQRTLQTVDPAHPGLLTDLMWLAWVANDMGDNALAIRLNQASSAGRVLLFGGASRYSIEARLQGGGLLFFSGDPKASRNELLALLADIPSDKAFQSYAEQATVWLAFTDPEFRRNLDLKALLQQRVSSLGVRSTQTRELSVQLAALALLEQDENTADFLLEKAEIQSLPDDFPYLAPLAWSVAAHRAKQAGLLAQANDFLNRTEFLLRQQNRRLFDPIDQRWLGAENAQMRTNRTSIANIGEKVIATRRALPAKNVPKPANF
jgi:serine/threonine protein kinase